MEALTMFFTWVVKWYAIGYVIAFVCIYTDLIYDWSWYSRIIKKSEVDDNDKSSYTRLDVFKYSLLCWIVPIVFVVMMILETFHRGWEYIMRVLNIISNTISNTLFNDNIKNFLNAKIRRKGDE